MAVPFLARGGSTVEVLPDGDLAISGASLVHSLTSQRFQGGDLPKRLPFKVFFALILVLILFPTPRTKGLPEVSAKPEPPKLILVLVIDQFRYDYLVRFAPQFVDGGFKLLLGGANFVDCRYDYATTATCPGHATLFTGAYPNIHGIIGNDWYDPSHGRRVYCVDDP